VAGRRVNDEFVRRFVRCQQDLFAYILALVPNTADAQDILQEMAIALCAKVDEYDVDQPFMPWAARFAWFQVRKFRMYQARSPRHSPERQGGGPVGDRSVGSALPWFWRKTT
jgi:DNA-directed RNA polymerase specialized sigma24 family protein